MSTTVSSNEVDNNRKSTTDNKRVTTAGKNTKNKEEGTEVFSEVGKDSSVHFYDGRRILIDEYKIDRTIFKKKYNTKYVQARFSKNVRHDPSK
jgi:hypothetical protein